MRHDTIVQTHVLDAEYDSAPTPPPAAPSAGPFWSPGKPWQGASQTGPTQPCGPGPHPLRWTLALLARSWSRQNRGLGRTPSWPLLGCHTPHAGFPGHLYFILVAPSSPSPDFLFLTFGAQSTLHILSTPKPSRRPENLLPSILGQEEGGRDGRGWPGGLHSVLSGPGAWSPRSSCRLPSSSCSSQTLPLLRTWAAGCVGSMQAPGARKARAVGSSPCISRSDIPRPDWGCCVMTVWLPGLSEPPLLPLRNGW